MCAKYIAYVFLYKNFFFLFLKKITSSFFLQAQKDVGLEARREIKEFALTWGCAYVDITRCV